jgi:hypothetical protein
MRIPDTLYAMAGDAAIPYQAYGSGEHRVVSVPGWSRTSNSYGNGRLPTTGSSDGAASPPSLSSTSDGGRGAGSAIYYLLAAGNVRTGTGWMRPRSGTTMRAARWS